MYIIKVIPITKGVQKSSLSYFSAEKIELGQIVSVPIKSRNIDAIVVEIEDAQKMKSELRTADFQLKKINSIKGNAPFCNNFFEACKRMSKYSLVNTGSVINALLPKVFLENMDKLEKPIFQEKISVETNRTLQEKLIFQSLTEDRLSWYRTLIREAFAKKESIFICVPTHYDIEKFEEALKKGIEQYVFTFYGDMSKKNLISAYNDCVTNPHPVLIIGTGMFLSIPRNDINTVILEHESSDSYKQFNRPFLDIRSFAEILTSITKIKIIFGDTLLRPDTYHRHENGELGEVASPLFRLPEVERQIVIDMKEEVDEKGKNEFKTLSSTVKKLISYSLEKNESVLLFTVRKGLAGITVCNDCRHTLLCPDCSTPIVLYGKKQRTSMKDNSERIFMCNKCGKKETTETRCPNCTSWNLNPLGIGTDRVYEEVKIYFPEATVIQIDKETTPTETEVNSAIKIFEKSPGSILIGTEMAFSYLKNKVSHSAIISLDGLLSIPSFNINQKILHIIEKLHYLTEHNLIIQTRTPENQILRHILSGNVLPIYREDLEERKQFNYPPFKRFIKITFSGTAQESEKARIFLDKILAGYDPQIFSAFVGKVRGQYVTNTIIRVDPKDWKLPISSEITYDENLSQNLLNLPPSFTVNVDPEDLL